MLGPNDGTKDGAAVLVSRGFSVESEDGSPVRYQPGCRDHVVVKTLLACADGGGVSGLLVAQLMNWERSRTP